jgi:hypothetical protein
LCSSPIFDNHPDPAPKNISEAKFLVPDWGINSTMA